MDRTEYKISMSRVVCMCIFLAAIILGGDKGTDGNTDAEVGLELEAGSTYTFDDLLDAIEWVESKGDPNAIGDNGKAVGAYQIHKIYIDDVNRIYNTRYTYDNRLDRVKSRRMVRLYTNWYSFKHELHGPVYFEFVARTHNGGPDGWKKESTKPYWEKVRARMESLK